MSIQGLEGKQLPGHQESKHLQAEDGRGRRRKETGSLMAFLSCSFKSPWNLSALEALIAREKNWSPAGFALTDACEQPNKAPRRCPHSLPARRAPGRSYHKAKAPQRGGPLPELFKPVHGAGWRKGKGNLLEAWGAELEAASQGAEAYFTSCVFYFKIHVTFSFDFLMLFFMYN